MTPTFQFGPGRLLGRTKIFSPLGIRFWDLTLNTPITSGLVVRAQWQNTDYPALEARRSPSGVYGFHGLPGQHDVEYPRDRGSASGSLPSLPSIPSLPSGREYVVFVEDKTARYLPAVFSVTLPLPYRGVFNSQNAGSLPAGGGKAFLFSAPTRPLPFGIGAIRADLWDQPNGRPAAYAALRVESGPDTWTAVADERGSVLVPFPYPLVDRLRLGSPPGMGQGDVSETEFPLKVRVRYQPSKLRFPLEGRKELGRPWTVTPSLKSILEEQGPAVIWETGGSLPIQVTELTSSIRYRDDVVLKTRMTGAGEDLSRLWITAAP